MLEFRILPHGVHPGVLSIEFSPGESIIIGYQNMVISVF